MASTKTPLRQLRDGDLPQMVRWYDPRLLARVGVRTIVSSVFGQYADQRIVQAATDAAPQAEVTSRYDYSAGTNAADPAKAIACDETGAYWVDYVADTGDGFEATYAMAYLLAQESVTVNEAGRLPAGQILIMGGDQCYPQATREEYKKRLLTPFNWAFDVDAPTRKLFAIPGNHDWYDGLAAFDSLFCSSRDRLSGGGGTAIGGWQCQQHRSYWSIRLPHGWWIWGTDIQFSKYLDNAQINYFELMAQQMKPGDKLIICMAEPSWLLADFQGQDEEENFYKITTIARKAGVKVAAIVAGDWHHYNRYYSHQFDVHLLTAGGGGAFLHPTHILKDSISLAWPEQSGAPLNEAEANQPRAGSGHDPQWRKRNVEVRLNKGGAQPVGQQVSQRVEEAIDEAVRPIEGIIRNRRRRPRILKPQAPKCYPEKGRSLVMSLRNVWFPFLNFPFAIGIGIIYWLITWEFYAVVERHDISAGKIDAVGVGAAYGDVFSYFPLYVLQAMLVSIPLSALLLGLWALLVSYVDATERPGFRRMFTKLTVGTAHFAAHLTTMLALALLWVMVNNWIAPRVEPWANALWQSSASDKSIAGGVVKEVLEPLSEARKQQRDQAGTASEPLRRAAPPTAEKQAEPSPDNQLRSKSVRQIVGFLLYPMQMILIGGLLGGFVWGLYWVITGITMRMHAEEAFAALRIKHYKNFLRFKIEPDKLTIYPLGIDRIPGDSAWTSRKRAEAVPSHNPQLVAKEPIVVRLIERPIVIHDEVST